MHEPTRDDRPPGDPDVTDAEALVNEQDPELDPGGPTELGDAVDD